MDQRPSILFLIDVLYSTYGGAEGVLHRITRELPKNRFRCAVATFASEPENVARDEFDCPVYCFPIRRTYDWNAMRMAYRLSRLIRKEKFSVLHTFFPASDLLGGLAAKLSGCPVVISSRRDMGFQRTFAQRIAYRLGRGLFDQVQTVGEMVRRINIEQDHLDPKRVVTIYNGVDLERIRCVRPIADWDCSQHWVVCVANLRRIKALEVFLRAAALVAPWDPLARFLIVGAVNDASYHSELMNLAKTLGIEDKVTFMGPQSDVPSILKRCDVFCLLSRSEGFSNAMLEAMACGLPCVGTDVGGNPELIQDGINGFLVPVNDHERAARSILALIGDRMLVARMGSAGRESLQSKFTLDRMMASMLHQYEILLGNSGVELRSPAKVEHAR